MTTTTERLGRLKPASSRSPVRRDRTDRSIAREMLHKVPEVTLYFWIINIMVSACTQVAFSSLSGRAVHNAGMETTDTGPEILVADAIYENGDRQGRPQPVTVRQLSRRTRWTATALTAVLAVGLLAAAIVAAVSAVIIATIVFLIGLVVRLAAKIVGARAVAGS